MRALPRCASRRIANVSTAGATCTGTKPGSANGVRSAQSGLRRLGGSMPHSRIQRWTRLAFRPLARARPATETPGSRQAETTDCLKASLCVRRLRRGISTSIVSTIELDGHDLQWDKQTAEGGFAGGLELGGEISAGASHGLCREPREARACSIRCAPVRGFQPRHP